MDSKQVWQRTDQAPVNEWVVCFWRTGQYSLGQYTHEHGWRDEDLILKAPPECWVALPTSSESEESSR